MVLGRPKKFRLQNAEKSDKTVFLLRVKKTEIGLQNGDKVDKPCFWGPPGTQIA